MHTHERVSSTIGTLPEVARTGTIQGAAGRGGWGKFRPTRLPFGSHGRRLVSSVATLPVLPSVPLYTIAGVDHSPNGSVAHAIQLVAGLSSVNGSSCPGRTGACLHALRVEAAAVPLPFRHGQSGCVVEARATGGGVPSLLQTRE